MILTASFAPSTDTGKKEINFPATEQSKYLTDPGTGDSKNKIHIS